MPLPILPGPPIDAPAGPVRPSGYDQGDNGGGGGPPIVSRPGQGQGALSPVGDGVALEERLRYGTSLHQNILARLNSRRELSFRHISKRYDGWDEVNEHCRLYIDLSRKAKKGDGTRDQTKAEMPFDRAIVIPMSLSILTVRLTQLMSIFGSREPMIQLEGRGPEDVRPAKLMEALLGYDLQQMKSFSVLYALCQDAEKYGMGVVHDCWEVEEGWRLVKPPAAQDPLMAGMLRMMGLGQLLRPQPVWGPTREFNNWTAVDPYCYWPDPRVPISQPQTGEFAGHRIFRGPMYFKERAIDAGGVYFNLEYLPKAAGKTPSRLGSRDRFDLSDFQLREAPEGDDRGFYSLDSMQVKLVPSAWNLGPGDRPEIWQFAWADEAVIVRAHRSEYLHGQFSYSVAESVPDEHALRNPGMIENLDGIQRVTDWLVNSHVDNVRKHLNDAVIYAPSLIEEADLLQPGPSRHVRVTEEAEKLIMQGQLSFGQILMQLPWADVTKQHLQTAKELYDMAQRLSAVSDPQMSQTTDTERTLGEVQQVIAGSSARLAITARLIDSMAILPLSYRAIANRQQFTEMDQFVRITGDLAKELGDAMERILIKPDDIAGQFDYIPHSGTVPPDPARFAEVWIKMLEGAAQIPQLFQPGPDGKVLDVREVFNQAARNMGVKNIKELYMTVMPNPAVAAAVQAGNMVPMPPNGQPLGDAAKGNGIPTPIVQGADLTS